jgi:hypothetical protein
MISRHRLRARLIVFSFLAIGWCGAVLGDVPTAAASPPAQRDSIGGAALPDGALQCRDGLLIDPVYHLPIGTTCPAPTADAVATDYLRTGVDAGIDALRGLPAAGGAASAAADADGVSLLVLMRAAPAPPAFAALPHTGRPEEQRPPIDTGSAIALIVGLVLVVAGIAVRRMASPPAASRQRASMRARIALPLGLLFAICRHRLGTSCPCLAVRSVSVCDTFGRARSALWSALVVADVSGAARPLRLAPRCPQYHPRPPSLSRAPFVRALWHPGIVGLLILRVGPAGRERARAPAWSAWPARQLRSVCTV